MMDTVWRLAWALPLVLVMGVAAVLMLKRFVVRTQPATRAAQRMTLRESLSLSDGTRVHLIEVEGKAWLVVESARQAVLQSTLPQASEMPRSSTQLSPPWMQRLCKAEPR